jgi:hypothetical protein
MTFNKKLVTAAVGGALTLGLGQSAQANLLFPYVVKDANRTTVITVIGSGAPASFGATLHLQYWTKSTTAANTAACEPNSTTMTLTANDIVTFDTAALLGSGALFGDTTNLAPLGTSIAYAAPRHGYLVVSWLLKGGPFAGSWLELDLANGGAHGDIARDDSTYQSDFGVFPTQNVDLLADVNAGRAVPFWPTSIVSSTFTVTPLGTSMETSDNTSVVMQVLNSAGVQGAYDRNENGVDGTVPQTVRCVGRLTAAQLMPGVVANAAWAATGGWGWLTNLGNGNTDYTQGCDTAGAIDCPAMVYQVDTSNAAGAGKFMSNATRVPSSDGPLIMISDMRLKRDIERVGETEGGLGLYSFRYLWNDEIHVGVMAQEVIRVRPDAVVVGADGYYRVDYGKLELAHLVN